MTNNLQSNSINLNNICTYFNLLIEQCLELESQLEKNASIIHNTVFEEAVVKVLYKYKNVLLLGEEQKHEAFIFELPIIDK
ncbi:2485_t:CDS:1, partial [Gigaspora margarita]